MTKVRQNGIIERKKSMYKAKCKTDLNHANELENDKTSECIMSHEKNYSKIQLIDI